MVRWHAVGSETTLSVFSSFNEKEMSKGECEMEQLNRSQKSQTRQSFGEDMIDLTKKKIDKRHYKMRPPFDNGNLANPTRGMALRQSTPTAMVKFQFSLLYIRWMVEGAARE